MSWHPSILNIVAKSPFKGLQKHMSIVTHCALELPLFFQATLEQRWAQAETLLDTITQLENKADELKMQLRLNLHKDLFLPVSRTDMLKLISTQDTVANKTRDIAGLMFGRKMIIPPPLTDQFIEYVQLSVDACCLADNTIKQLHAIIESGFGGNIIEVVEKMITQLNEKEHHSDQVQIRFRQELFDLEATLPPITVMFLYRIVEDIGTLANCAQNIGEQLLLMVAH